MNDIYTVSLNDIAPPNLINDTQIHNIITALDPQLQTISSQSANTLIIPKIDTAPDKLLDILAVQFHSDFYDLAGTTDMKRGAVKDSIKWHMKKGTVSAIIQALKILGIDAEFIPWWKFGGQPYTFRLKAYITGDFYMGAGKDKITKLITRAVNESKSARSLMAYLDTILKFSETYNIKASLAGLTAGNMLISLNNHDIFPHNVIYSAYITKTENYCVQGLYYDSQIEIKAVFGHVRFEYINDTLGVNILIMQELLLQFEKRIFARIDKLESLLDAKIDTVIEMLRWKGEDDPL